MADKKISALTSATTPLAGTEVIPIVQSGATKKVAVDDLTVKNFRSNSASGILQVAGPSAGSTRVMTVPDSNFSTARIDAAQSFTGDQTLSTGNLVIGTNGKGIDFSATSQPSGMTSELLNDYEEGTWTPAFSVETPGTLSVTYGGRYGNYVKIGKQVTVTGYISVDSFSRGTGVGSLLITGLPYTVGSIIYAISRNIEMYNAPLSNYYQPVMRANYNQANIVMQRQIGTNPTTTSSLDDPAAGAVYAFTVTYFV